MWLWQFVTSDFFTSHPKRVVSDDPIRIQDLTWRQKTTLFSSVPPYFAVSAWFCLFHVQIKESHECSLAKDLSASSAWQAKYWAHQLSQKIGGHLNISPHGWEITCPSSLALWSDKFMLHLFSKPYETYCPSRMEKANYSAVTSKKATLCLLICILLPSKLILQKPKLQC